MGKIAVTRKLKSKIFTYSYTGGSGSTSFFLHFDSEFGAKNPEKTDNEITVLLYTELHSGSLGSCVVEVFPVDQFDKRLDDYQSTPPQDFLKQGFVPQGAWVEMLRGVNPPFAWVFTIPPKCYGLQINWGTQGGGTESATITIEVIY
ncbi:MAG: hypothetical protein AMQ22_00202 [Candidatus Methanofastidiosum methylothiophilum]|uniref:Uncharacterized protein n=1 Tax=Candidatus Methanofastidiosum methylothiophilum TaxID=1705564 RepID=A0A150J8K6_9EURY|nr:MAG: hypothetical protein APG11_00839 [Candidatus Methanofastidiosum methylthiophilus]KYC53531.1 MAG: hypothetical protein AMQ22_00202 [Candidatus Methanofastidiosum methylthiophilus]